MNEQRERRAKKLGGHKVVRKVQTTTSDDFPDGVYLAEVPGIRASPICQSESESEHFLYRLIVDATSLNDFVNDAQLV